VVFFVADCSFLAVELRDLLDATPGLLLLGFVAAL
jgi:hypothetical protein